MRYMQIFAHLLLLCDRKGAGNNRPAPYRPILTHQTAEYMSKYKCCMAIVPLESLNGAFHVIYAVTNIRQPVLVCFLLEIFYK